MKLNRIQILGLSMITWSVFGIAGVINYPDSAFNIYDQIGIALLVAGLIIAYHTPNHPENVDDDIRSYKTTEGESLSDIAHRELGDERKWSAISYINRESHPGMGPQDSFPTNTNIKLPNFRQ